MMRQNKKTCPHPQSQSSQKKMSQSSPSRDEVPEDTPISSMPIEMDPCSSTELDASTSLLNGKGQSSEMSENSDIPLTNLLNDNVPGNDTLDAGLPPTSSLSDSWVKNASDLLLVEDDLCLDTLLDNVIYIHAQKGKSYKSSSFAFRQSCQIYFQDRTTMEASLISEGLHSLK